MAGKIEILNKPFVRRPIKTTIEKKKRDKTKANKKVPNFNIALNCDMIVSEDIRNAQGSVPLSRA